MSDTTFVDRTTPVTTAWLNDANAATYYAASVLVSIGGTADVVTAAIAAPPTNVVAGQVYYLPAVGANTSTAPTLTLTNGPALWTTAKTIKLNGGLVPVGYWGTHDLLAVRWDAVNSIWDLVSVTSAARAIATTTSFAGLRATPKTSASYAWVSGGTTEGDNNGGLYWYNAADTTTADNGRTIIVGTDGGRWYLLSAWNPLLYPGTTTAGTAPNFTLSPYPAITAYATGQTFPVVFNAAGTTGSNTLDVDALGAKNLKQYDSTGTKQPAVIANGMITRVEYDGTDMLVLDPLPSSIQATETILGSVKIATATEVAAGTDDTAAVTALKMWASTAFSGAGPYSLTLPSWIGGNAGLILKWGLSGFVASSSSLAITFATAFPTAAYAVYMTRNATSLSSQGADYVSALSTTGFTIHNASPDSTTNFYWFAIGK